jgi:hypothetical protein
MRLKQPRLIITFHTTTAAMGMEIACGRPGLPGRLIPVPREITAGCGMAWSAPPEARADLEAFVQQESITTDGWYELTL